MIFAPRPPWVLRLRLDNALDRRAIDMAIDLEELMVDSRVAEELRLGHELGAHLVTFHEGVAVMKARDDRRLLLRDAALQLAAGMADRLEDREGWHGEERRERILKAERLRR